MKRSRKGKNKVGGDDGSDQLMIKMVICDRADERCLKLGYVTEQWMGEKMKMRCHVFGWVEMKWWRDEDGNWINGDENQTLPNLAECPELKYVWKT